ncbi:MAG: hypothetical protein R2788_14505 [Saprospiraceae bacterium]
MVKYWSSRVNYCSIEGVAEIGVTLSDLKKQETRVSLQIISLAFRDENWRIIQKEIKNGRIKLV